uniref:Protein kinase domain-containing protein n=1 Tax=Chromera velia CCMP2878 TaxID=1169474 RepID=A0A0G4I872_9ALVE|eukprot:Cvel_1957.t1-p1 / transcript=Cvel_1957.t1 / gene=Cvel_1957 / organism=Chromera_velia_CCMP2878 / gene_product=hypothetical protein / transcript_product=hypothetical protein / location=Cvel_scaffold74:48109-50327(-) / protein_length=651 / sequence_SO=supercontig / SO=protein_coding / is_pseudo=false
MCAGEYLGAGAFGRVVSVSVNPSVEPGTLYSGVEAGKTYALKHMRAESWTSPLGEVSFSESESHLWALKEMCIAREAGKGGVGPMVFGTWFCRVPKEGEGEGETALHGFMLMEQLQLPLKKAFEDAEMEDLIVTPDAQRSVLGLHEKFADMGYAQLDNHHNNAGVDLSGRFRLLDFGVVETARSKKRKIDHLTKAVKRLKEALALTSYFRQSKKHKSENVALQTEQEVDQKKYKWGSMEYAVEKVVYPFPKNKKDESEKVVYPFPKNKKDESDENLIREDGEVEDASPQALTDPSAVSERRNGSLFLEDIQPHIAKAYQFHKRNGVSPPEIKALLEKDKTTRKGDTEPVCLSSPPERPKIETQFLTECHPGLVENSELGGGAFGKVVSVSVDPAGGGDNHGNSLWSGLEMGKRYALKEMGAGKWASDSHQSVLTEMCVAEDAGKFGIGPKVYGSWFCQVTTQGKFTIRKVYGFILMEELQMPLRKALRDAREKNLIVTPDAQKSALGLHEKFFESGYVQSDNHFGNAGVDMEGRLKLLDFGIVKSSTEVYRKTDVVEVVVERLVEILNATPYFSDGKHKSENFALEAERAIQIETYEWGTMIPLTEKVVYPFPEAGEIFRLRGAVNTQLESSQKGREVTGKARDVNNVLYE